MDHAARLIEFLTKGKTWFVPSVIVRPEAVVDSFARGIEDPTQSLSEENPDFTQSLSDALLLKTAVHTKELSPSDHYNLIVVAMDYMVRNPHGYFAPEDAMFLLYTMLCSTCRNYPRSIRTFATEAQPRLSLLLYRDVGLVRLVPEGHFAIAYLLMHHCRAAMRDLPERANNHGVRVAIGEEITKAGLDKEWRGWFLFDEVDVAQVDRLIADMMVWRKRLVEEGQRGPLAGH